MARCWWIWNKTTLFARPRPIHLTWPKLAPCLSNAPISMPARSVLIGAHSDHAVLVAQLLPKFPLPLHARCCAERFVPLAQPHGPSVTQELDAHRDLLITQILQRQGFVAIGQVTGLDMRVSPGRTRCNDFKVRVGFAERYELRLNPIAHASTAAPVVAILDEQLAHLPYAPRAHGSATGAAPGSREAVQGRKQNVERPSCLTCLVLVCPNIRPRITVQQIDGSCQSDPKGGEEAPVDGQQHARRSERIQ